MIEKSVGLSSAIITGSPDISAQPTLLCDPRSGLKDGQFINGSCFGLPTPGHNGPFILPYIKGPAFLNSDISLYKNIKFGESARKLQFRASGYNFLNHPIQSFLNGDQNLNLAFDSSGKLSNQKFGYASYRLGHRSIQLAVKYYF